MIKKTVLFSLLILAMMSCNESKEKEKECCSTKPGKLTEHPVETPETSVYQLSGEWTDQHGNELSLETLAGNPVVMTMIFTHCEYACPMMVNDLKLLENQFSPAERKQTRFVLVSFDHLRDTPERLHEYAQSQEMGDNWILLHGSADQVKELSVVLNISYEQMENGSFSHGNKKVILDKNGTIVFVEEGLQRAPDAVVRRLQELI